MSHAGGEAVFKWSPPDAGRARGVVRTKVEKLRSAANGAASVNRVLGHLYATDRRTPEEYEATFAICREGIAHSLDLSASTVARSLARLIEQGHVVAHRRVVKLVGGRRSVFFLTDKGRAAARELAQTTAGIGAKSASHAEGKRPFVGRPKEVARLRAWSNLPGGVVIVEGPAGIGKTALVRHALTGRSRDPVFSYAINARSTPRNLAVSFAEFFSARGRRDVAGVLAGNGNPDTEVIRRAIISSLDGWRGLLFVDDVHKASPEIQRILSSMFSMAARGHCRLLLAGREVGGLVTLGPDGEGFLDEITLGPLDIEESRRVLRARGIPDDEIDGIARVASGVPLILCLAQAGVRPVRSSGVVAHLRAVNARLSDPERRILWRAAIRRVPAPAETIAPDEGNVHLVGPLARRGLLLKDDRGWVVHELLRDHYLGILPAGISHALHAEAAQRCAIDGSTDEVVEAMHHFRQADMDDEAAALVVSHGRKLFWEGYHTELRSALESLRDGRLSPRQRSWRTVLLAAIMNHAGREEDAIALARQVMSHRMEDSDPELAAFAAYVAGVGHRFLRRFDEGIQLLAEALERLDGSRGKPHYIDLANMQACLFGLSGNHEKAWEFFDRNRRDLEALGGDPHILAKTHSNLCESLRYMHRYPEARAHGESALRLVADHDLQSLRFGVNLHLAWLNIEMGDYAKAASSIEQASATNRAPMCGNEHELLWAKGRLLVETGESEQAVPVLERAEALASQAKDAAALRAIRELADRAR